MAKKIMGIDPGTIVTGYGIICTEGPQLKALDFGCIRPPKNMKLSDRYMVIFDCVDQLIEKHAPDAVAIETQFVQKNPQSAIKLGMARGIILLAAKKRGVAVFEYAPTRAKRAVVGNGSASKAQVQGMVQRLLNLIALPQPEDAADALSLAICHANAIKFQQALGLEL